MSIPEQEFQFANKKEREHFEFLDSLRTSGQTNMYGAGPYLVKRFRSLSEARARKILVKWIETFTDRGCPGRDD